MAESQSLTRREVKLIDAAAAVKASDGDPDELAFGAKCLVSASLPYRNPKPEQLVNGAWVRQNGDYTLWIQGGPEGLPYGTYPRLFIIWLTSEAVRTESRVLRTGGSFSEFCRKLNIDRSRGKRGTGRAFIDQAERLLSSRAAFITNVRNTNPDRSGKPGRRGSGIVKTDKDFLPFADHVSLFFESDDERQGSLFQSEIVLTEKFFNEITSHCIPLDLVAVRALQQSPLELDIYQWLAYRMYKIREETRPTWQSLYGQFGSSYGRIRAFREAFLDGLKRVKNVYPSVRVDVNESGLILLPSPTPVRPNRPHAVAAA